MTATDTRSTASPDSPAPKPERTPRRIMSFSHKLSRWDLKVSPYLYISPFFILFVIVGLFPIAYTAVISFQEWDLVRNTGEFVGFEQYIWILTQEQFWVALRNTFSIFLLSSVPQIILALFIAAMLDRNIRAEDLLAHERPAALRHGPGRRRADLQQPVRRQPRPREQRPHQHRTAADPVAQGARSGATSRSRPWSTSAGPATTPSSCSPRCRRCPATTTKRRPSTAPNAFRQFWSITLPSLRPTLIFVIITSTIGGLQIFDEPRLYDNTGKGGAAQQWLTITLYLYNIGWGEFNFGRAAALAWILFLIILVIGLINLMHHPPPRPRRGRPRRRQTPASARRESSDDVQTTPQLAIVEESIPNATAARVATSRPIRDPRLPRRLLGVRGPRRRHHLGGLPLLLVVPDRLGGRLDDQRPEHVVDPGRQLHRQRHRPS